MSIKKNNNKNGNSPEGCLKRILFEWQKIFYKHSTLSTFSLLLASFLIAFTLYPHLLIAPKHYKLGDIAQRDIKAKRDFLVEDTVTTAKYRQEAMAKVPPVYEFKEEVWLDLKERIKKAFAQMRQFLEENRLKRLAKTVVKSEDTENLKIHSDKEMKGAFEKILGVKLNLVEFQILKKEGFSSRLEELLYQLLEPLYTRGIVTDKTSLIKARYGIVLVFKNPSHEHRIFNPDRLLSIEEAKQEIYQQRYILFNELKRQPTQVVIKIATKLIKPNVFYNPTETYRRKMEAAKNVKPVFYQVKKGEIIVREGEKINQMELLKLQAQQKQTSHKHVFLLFLGLTGLIFVSLWVTKNVSAWLNPVFFQRQSNFCFWLSNIFFFFVLGKLGLEVGSLFAQNFPIFSAQAFVYALPINGATMLLTLFTQPQLGLVIASLMAGLTGLMLKSSSFFLYFLVGGFWVALRLHCCRHRGTLIKVGLELGIIQAMLVLFINTMHQEVNYTHIPLDLGLALLGGIASSVVVLGLTPIVEIIFGYTSDIRLLELASLDQPLLKELMVKAPGTYHHSVVVAQLVEAVAEEIGANPLLAKVAAYYHDIGKMKKTLYFIENQIGVENKHDKLNPSMSALIIMSHVKDGVELAQKYGLGNAIIDIIRQHHGTNLITYFYHKAKEQNPNVKEEDFRYPGPKPQTKEAGLVMLADAVEAASRSLVDPSPSRIKTTVQKVISNLFLDGQLDECELTLKDIHKIEEMFTKVLIGIFHPRIEYPEVKKEGKNGSNL